MEIMMIVDEIDLVFWCVHVQKVAMLADINLHTSILKRLSLWDPKGLVIRCRRAAPMLHGLYPYPQWISARRTVCSIMKQHQRHAAETLLLGATRYIHATVPCSGTTTGLAFLGQKPSAKAKSPRKILSRRRGLCRGPFIGHTAKPLPRAKKTIGKEKPSAKCKSKKNPKK
jgi:hypothetical protein